MFNPPRLRSVSIISIFEFQFESLKSEQINCGCFFDTMSDFNVPGSRPKKHDEISEIDRRDDQADWCSGSDAHAGPYGQSPF